MPLTLGRAFSSAEKGQRLEEAAFFSLEILTTQGMTFCTASTTGVRRERASARTEVVESQALRAKPRPMIAAVPNHRRLGRIRGNNTMVIPSAWFPDVHANRVPIGVPFASRVFGMGDHPIDRASPLPARFRSPNPIARRTNLILFKPDGRDSRQA